MVLILGDLRKENVKIDQINAEVNSSEEPDSSSNYSLSDALRFESSGNDRLSFLGELEELPQGRHLGHFSTVVLFVSRIVGSGIFATSLSIYQDVGGSPFLFLLSWAIAALLSFSGLYVYLELGSLVPRSGGTKVFLEFIYEKPFMLANVVFLVYSVVFGFTVLNALVFGQYFLHSLSLEPSEVQIRVAGLAFVYLACLIHGISVSHGVKVQNFLGGLKLLLLFLMVVTSFYLIFFPKAITHLESYLHWNTFFQSKSRVSASTFASAIIKASFSFSGWNSVHTVSSEIKDPTSTFKVAGPLSLIIVTFAYFLINIAYLVVIPDKEIVGSGKLIGSLLFEKVFGVRIGRQLLTMSIAICAGGNIFVVVYTISRVSQEVFREGFLPMSKFFASNWPFGAPLPTLALSCLLSTIVIMAPPVDIYNYIIAVEGFPNQLFIALSALGIFIIRRRYPEVRAPIRASLLGTIFVLLVTGYLVITPYTSNKSPNPIGMERWPSYSSVGLFLLSCFAIYWFIIFELLPWMFEYELMAQDMYLDDGLKMKKWIKVSRIGTVN